MAFMLVFISRIKAAEIACHKFEDFAPERTVHSAPLDANIGRNF